MTHLLSIARYPLLLAVALAVLAGLVLGGIMAADASAVPSDDYYGRSIDLRLDVVHGRLNHP